MALRCPVCGRSFADSAKHCDQDGAPLLQVRKPRRFLVPLLGLLTAISVAIAAPYWLKAHLRSSISMQFAGVEFPTVSATRELKLRMGPERLRITARIANASMLPVALNQTSYTIAVNGAEIYRGAIAQELTVPAGGNVQHVFDGGRHEAREFTLPADALPEAGVQITATSTATAAQIRETVTFSASARLQLQLPALDLEPSTSSR